MHISTGNGIVSSINDNQRSLKSLKAGQFVDTKNVALTVAEKTLDMKFRTQYDKNGYAFYSGTIIVTYKTHSKLTPMATCQFRINNNGITEQIHPAQDIQSDSQWTYIELNSITATNDGLQWEFTYNNQGLGNMENDFVSLTSDINITFQVIANMSGALEVSYASD